MHPRNARSLGNFLATGYRVAASMTLDAPVNRVLSDAPAPVEPTVAVGRHVVRKDL